ncbi:MAG: gliding motility-associated C-terminal domain-containing protein [Chitinophagaceae bacterium]|nr:gliding motility-associated C-terminal domain-containing protein [Chitinophagaceae bacterium]
MRSILSVILFLLCIESTAQAPPVIQWQNCIGGSGLENPMVIIGTSDGGYIIGGTTTSNDGDITGHIDSSDLLIIKINNNGIIDWQRCYGGGGNEYASDMLQTPDGGYIIIGSTSSVSGDVTMNHGSTDIWVLKISGTGILEWQRCYGSSGQDGSTVQNICFASGGGYIISSIVTAGDGDVTGYHTPTSSPNLNNGDLWVIKIDLSGNIVWQRCIGGTKRDSPGALVATSDGGYIVACHAQSIDGDMNCATPVQNNLIFFKLNDSGNIIWKNCISAGSLVFEGLETPEGDFIFAGGGTGILNSLSDMYIMKMNVSGQLLWEKRYGGSQSDLGNSIMITNDGGYLVAGHTATSGEFICNFKGGYDVWLVKVDRSGELLWQKPYGGSKPEETMGGIVQTSDGGFLLAATSQSNDGDVSGLLGFNDLWLVKFSFPGIEILPTISITSGETTTCVGKDVIFVATASEGGDAPLFQWQVNGVNAAANNDTIVLNSLTDGDVITCILTSNSPCVTTRTDTSNAIQITVDPSKTPVDFLPLDADTICIYGSLELRPVGNFKTYLWSTGAVTPSIDITQPGTYLLQVTTSEDCPGIDSVTIFSKECLKGFYMPTGFSPNSDGRNDILKPFLGGRIVQYRLMILNRWGQVVFQSTDPGKGWDGTFNGVKQNNDVFVWSCTYQFAGEALKSEKGTVVIVR